MDPDFLTIIVAVITSGLLNTVASYLITLREKKKDANEDVKNACRLIMKDRLRFLCKQYIIQGWIYEDELEDLLSMHHCYHDDLNGNGFLDELMSKVKALEIRGMGVK